MSQLMAGIILQKNGFTKTSETEFSNETCEIKIMPEYYNLRFQMDGEWWTMCSTDLSIYWLFGVLIWYDLISQPIKK